ncbi:hypothetical protein [Sphingomonas mollis]|uniref:Flagellar export protein FliJ n=1 Tax=Sphingomonas mollis TaxID=2795726 RepID=A0ABS0XU62_9SPHN|nr:hypothetical protein [Sphingomonas sp. BT553]MBJ6123583.1 hypothetical protein [Sphingomonas sp. BT553]
MTRAATLARIHRVRTLQLGLARADEMRHHDTLASETALTDRIAALVDAVAPTAEVLAAQHLSATAFYRERLQLSADAAASRVRVAGHRAMVAEEATRAAKRDQTAVEKLLDGARRIDLARAMRALEDMPAVSKGKRHGPC